MPPAPTARVNDYASALPEAARARLERILADGEQATGAQVVMAIFPALEGENLEDFSIRLAERWRIGRKGLDDGVIVLVFIQDRKVLEAFAPEPGKDRDDDLRSGRALALG